jgi:15-cis-phytoene synthase
VSERHASGADALEDAYRQCEALARAEARDQWLGALYAPAQARNGLFALASFDHEIRQARFRARDPNLAAIRLAWWRDIVRGERDDEAAGSPVALAFNAAIDAFALPRASLEAMLDAQLQEMAPQDDFNLAAFAAFADESEGVGLSLAGRIAGGGRDLDKQSAHAPAGMALALARMLLALPFRAGSGPTLIPADVAERHGATTQEDFGARRARLGVVAACAELRSLAREKLAEAESRLKASPQAILPAFIPLGALRLDLDRLDRNAERPFDPPAEASPLRRQWAIWRWARGR